MDYRDNKLTSYRANELSSSRGFTMLELLIVISLTAILLTVGLLQLAGVARERTLTAATERVSSDLSRARGHAMSGEDQRKWGVHFVNNGDDYYELFSTPTTYSNMSTTVEETIYLTEDVTFSDPAAMATKDIIFTGITGTTTASSVTLTSSSGSETVSVTTAGTID